MAGTAAVAFESVSLAFDDNVVLRDISFSVLPGHMAILVGASGVGKSIVLKLILGLLKPDSGIIRINGERTDNIEEKRKMQLRADVGMLFQESALFDSLTVAENVGYKLIEHRHLPDDEVRRCVVDALARVGLEEHIDKMPSALSGGQRRRVAIARALVGSPALLLLDELTSGLDPVTAKLIDREIIRLRDVEQVTSVVATHQLPDAFYVAQHAAVRQAGGWTIGPADAKTQAKTEFVMLREGRIAFRGTASEMRASGDPELKLYLSGWIPPLVA